jgi:beta-galactosidase
MIFVLPYPIPAMNRLPALILGAAGLCSLLGAAPARADDSPRQTLAFDAGWQFSRGDFAGASLANFSDEGWQSVDLPHDWSILGPFDRLNPTGGAGAFLPAGVGWYRKHFRLPASDSGKRVFVEFDGVMANGDVWINGEHLGRRPYGYVSFGYELTRYLKLGDGADNVLAVRADDSDQPASRWYSGAGIYRHVRLVVTDPLHIDTWGTFVSTPVAAADSATVRVRNSVVNQGRAPQSVSIRVTLIDPSGQPVGTSTSSPQQVAPGGSADFTQDLTVAMPALWDLDSPNLYRAVSVVEAGGADLDRTETAFGIRDAHFEAATGFWLNGRNIKIKGVCLHSDGSAFGAAVPLDVWARRLRILKDLGANAIRCAHNPPSPEFLDLCDRMGFLVMDEMFDCWTVAKNIADYHLYFDDWSKIDTRDTVRRDRNHPSIILYSAGNEIHDTPDAVLSKRILSGLVAVFHENDPTRPVTQALLRPNATHDYDDGLADLLDVVGTNYRDSELLAAHDAKPTRKIIGTENHMDRQGWLAVRDHAPYSGQFLWAGIDYLGESPLWPLVGSRSGLIDRIGTPYPVGLERRSWWSDRPVVSMVRRVSPPAPRITDPGYTPGEINYRLRPPELYADWNPSDPSPHQESVEVYSNAAQVELFLNGQSLGTQALHPDASARVWKVAYAPGEIRAVASEGGKVVATDELRTAGSGARIVLTADRDSVGGGWDSVDQVTATVVDANGVVVPNAADEIAFQVSGPGALAAVDSGDNASHESFRDGWRRAYQGRCAAFIRGSGASGRIVLTASSPGLVSGSVAIDATANP